MTIVRWNRLGNTDRWADWARNLYDNGCECSDFVPRADVIELEGGYDIRLELPGLDRESVNVNVEKNVLTVSGERKAPESADGHYRRIERHYGTFSRTFYLSDGVDVNGIQARMDKGILTISLPKREETKPRSIEVAVN